MPRGHGAAIVISWWANALLGRVLTAAATTALVLVIGLWPAAPAAAICAIEAAPELAQFQASFGLGCAAAPPALTWSAEQFFERGVMLWREDSRAIFVLSTDGSWQGFDDRFYEGQADRAGLAAPQPWLREPIRGFGLVWRERLGGARAAIGWATNDEQGLDARTQPFDNGLVFQNAAGRTFVLVKDRTWRRP
ncbi:MAG TPA: hypothetical protein VEQ11_09000 [Chloroflexota bacterium]|nr:hypothetical protein [Chloroflexota bacterium]